MTNGAVPSGVTADAPIEDEPIAGSLYALIEQNRSPTGRAALAGVTALDARAHPRLLARAETDTITMALALLPLGTCLLAIVFSSRNLLSTFFRQRFAWGWPHDHAAAAHLSALIFSSVMVMLCL